VIEQLTKTKALGTDLGLILPPLVTVGLHNRCYVVPLCSFLAAGAEGAEQGGPASPQQPQSRLNSLQPPGGSAGEDKHSPELPEE